LSAYQLLRPKPVVRASQNEPVSISQSSPSGLLSEKQSSAQPIERMLRDLDAQWANAAAAKDVEQTIGYYSDDAIVLPPNATRAATKEAIRNVWKDMLGSPGLVITWKPTKVQVGKSGETAWVSGMYELTINDVSGKPVNDRGKYLEVWEQQADGN